MCMNTVLSMAGLLYGAYFNIRFPRHFLLSGAFLIDCTLTQKSQADFRLLCQTSSYHLLASNTGTWGTSNIPSCGKFFCLQGEESDSLPSPLAYLQIEYCISFYIHATYSVYIA